MQVLSFRAIFFDPPLIYMRMHCVPNTLRFLIPGQSGKLQIFELASGALLETVDAHGGALWSLCLAPDQVQSRLAPAQHPVPIWPCSVQ